LQRQKEGSADYRYFPEPDIPPIVLTDEHIENLKNSIPELPDQKIARYQRDFGLNNYDAGLLASDINFAAGFDTAVGQHPSPQMAKFVANLFLGAIKTYLNESQTQLDIAQINPDFFNNLFQSVTNSQISATVAKQVIVDSLKTGQDPVAIATSKGLIQVSDSEEIKKLAQAVIDQNPKAVQDYKKNPASIGFLIGQLMKASQGSANPQIAKETLEKLLQ